MILFRIISSQNSKLFRLLKKACEKSYVPKNVMNNIKVGVFVVNDNFENIIAYKVVQNNDVELTMVPTMPEGLDEEMQAFLDDL